MATLYRCRTPTNVLCPCGRVARELRRQGIDVDEVRVPVAPRDRDEVAALSGQRTVPMLVIDGEAICDSQPDRRAPALAARPGFVIGGRRRLMLYRPA